MEIIHTGLAASTEENADRFFTEILGLEKSEPRSLDKDLVQALFGINNELVMLHYKGKNAHYEVFIQPGFKAPEKQVAHSCIKVADLKKIVGKCNEAGLKVNQIPKGTAVVTFVSDFDGNLYEVKE